MIIWRDKTHQGHSNVSDKVIEYKFSGELQSCGVLVFPSVQFCLHCCVNCFKFYSQKLFFFYPHLSIKSKTSAYRRHLLQNVEWNLVDGKALDYRFYTQSRQKKTNKAFAYRVPIGDYNHLQCSIITGDSQLSQFSRFDKEITAEQTAGGLLSHYILWYQKRV